MNAKSAPQLAGGQGLPLRGTRVLCMAGQYPGPYATMLLADLGADVVMVERPEGDPTRAMPVFYESLNRNKRSITIDAKRADDRKRLLSLIGYSDVFIEGSRPGVADRLGLGAAQLRANDPRLIYVSISAFGQTGPYRDRAAHDLSLQALGGLLSGREDAGAAHPYVPWGDVLSGLFAAFGIASALVHRQSSGDGATIDIAMSDCLVSAMTTILGPLLNRAQPFVILQPGYGNYRCSDGGWINLSITHEDHLWKNLVVALGLDDLRDLDTPTRSRRAADLRTRLAQKVALYPRAHWEQVLSACDTAWAPVLSPDEVITDPHFVVRKLFARLSDGRRAVRQPIHFSDDEGEVLGAAPSLGGDNESLEWSS